ncbi:8191_t:CDS:2 [Ambispora leptoticha]|uniref:8191_t:CDS:1 n=1 Tax=Ambispora leptoticha TaxID=144679 RepID=A0A9N8ZFC4_9GLOM|nr:8191_t:CDS:2 [Ambispora leptoticha]
MSSLFLRSRFFLTKTNNPTVFRSLYPRERNNKNNLLVCSSGSSVASNIRKYASASHDDNDEHSTEETAKFPKEPGFNTPFWRNSLFVVILGFAWYHVDKYITKNGLERHPITALVESWITPEPVNRRIQIESMLKMEAHAKERLEVQELEKPLIRRIRYPEAFDIKSPYNVIPGTEVDLSDLVIRKDYY